MNDLPQWDGGDFETMLENFVAFVLAVIIVTLVIRACVVLWNC